MIERFGYVFEKAPAASHASVKPMTIKTRQNATLWLLSLRKGLLYRGQKSGSELRR